MSSGDPVRPFASQAAPVAVIAALGFEAKALGVLARGPGMQLHVSGPGPLRAAAAARRAVAAGARALLSWGLAGGLSSELDCGAVLVPARVLASSGAWLTDPAWRQAIAGIIGERFALSEGALVSAAEVVTRPQAKAELASRYGAVAVDMESAAVAEVAAGAGLPFVVIRVIADRSNEALPERIDQLVSADGRTRYRGLWGLLLSPAGIPLLFALARRSAQSRKVLGAIAAEFAEGLQ